MSTSLYHATVPVLKQMLLALSDVLKKGEDLPVRSFQIALDSAGRPATVDFEISSENLIYLTSKKLSMHLVSGRVVSYTISGSQALRWFSSPTRYSVSGVVL